ncbi:P-loop containing nucleoside triphosphate hydrolase protein [Emericellopsis atlantica]|uniref:P-loop containing nucleoside triphosphate hydrolase protein n=1 Tax=Emericellopsis atlantica TaxID=2614577 RepID=A0A9P8CXQ7_9HYPO|nr:P-loop containing nucleoside triphosphate hydrolase protein [Emericellopsis atlantica]KAG9259066.1 P-loop containing nucleoside triphosphate hydrolase protein [Emericellopsis atlantica]
MDYHAVHGHDVASFDVPSSHRLPTVSASAALEELVEGHATHISTGIGALDRLLAAEDLAPADPTTTRGGIKRGQVTEIWGPPGSGKVALSLQLAANAIKDNQDVVWLDCFQDISLSRLRDVLEHHDEDPSSPSTRKPPGAGSGLDHFAHYKCLTLPHFIALISRPTTKALPESTSLVVISSIAVLINSALPKAQDGRFQAKLNRGSTPTAKRRQALQSIMKSLQTLASTRSCAVVVLSQCSTKMQSEHGATLVPSINGSLWDQGVSTRLALFRDWHWKENKPVPICLVGVQKLDGKSLQDSSGKITAFEITNGGLTGLQHDGDYLLDTTTTAMEQTRMKRKIADTGFEVPDSEDDDYGWAEDDEAAMPPPPSQWQGSEDVILGHEIGQSDDDNSIENEEDEVGVARPNSPNSGTQRR